MPGRRERASTLRPIIFTCLFGIKPAPEAIVQIQFTDMGLNRDCIRTARLLPAQVTRGKQLSHWGQTQV